MRRKALFLMAVVCGGFWALQAQVTVPRSLEEDKAQVMGDADWKLWNPALQAEIDAQIERNRKADAVVAVQLPKGTEVRVEQLSHDFIFGAHIFNFDQLGTDERNRKYKEVYGSLFNGATLAFYWKTFEPVQGCARYKAGEMDSASYWNNRPEPWYEYHWRRPSPEKIIEFCEAKGIHMHGHPLIWGRRQYSIPYWMSVAPDKKDEMERLFAKHVHEIADYYGNKIPSWDVVNESVDPVPGEPRYGVMPDDYTYKTFKEADKAFPSSVLLNINDSWREVYPPFIKDLIDREAGIDVIGLQMHIFTNEACLDIAAGKDVYTNNTSWTPESVKGYLEELDKLERPIHISEITIPAPGKDERANQIQAILTYNMYRLWFSWPSVFRITWWNVVDDCGAAGEPVTSGLFTRDMQPKPVYHVLDQLINHDWKTKLTVRSDANGQVKFRGFRGEYRLTWKDKTGETHSMTYHLK